jgi:hypothetical protein
MSSQEPKVNSYLEFMEDVLPRIRKLGYNAIQIMAIQVGGCWVPQPSQPVAGSRTGGDWGCGRRRLLPCLSVCQASF